MVPVVVYLLFLLMLSSASADSTRNITLPGCPASCGNVSNIFYPFGIKPGCFRSGFQLTCTNSKLLLGDSNGTVEVTQIDIRGNQVSVNGPIFTMPADADADSYSTYWTPLKGGPYMVSAYRRFNVVGCGIAAYLADSETGEVTGMCLSVCGSSNDSVVYVGSDLRSGNGYCSVFINSTVSKKEFEIRLDRLHGEGEGRASGKAFLTPPNWRQDLSSSDLIGGSSAVPLDLDWAITDPSSCEEAERNVSTYACRSNHSLCYDQYQYLQGGYTCMCLISALRLEPGLINPYISGGCPGS